MIINRKYTLAKLKIIDDNTTCIASKPNVDVGFGSAATVYSDSAHTTILVAMIIDGCEGTIMLKNKGATIFSQNEETCVFYGMHHAISVAGLSEITQSLESFTYSDFKEVQYG